MASGFWPTLEKKKIEDWEKIDSKDLTLEHFLPGSPTVLQGIKSLYFCNYILYQWYNFCLNTPHKSLSKVFSLEVDLAIACISFGKWNLVFGN